MGFAAINPLKHTYPAELFSFATPPLLTVFHTLTGGKRQLVALTHEQDDRLGSGYAVESAGERSAFTACQRLAVGYIYGKNHHALIFTLRSGTLYGFNTLRLTRAGKRFLVYIAYIIGGIYLGNHISQCLRQWVAI